MVNGRGGRLLGSLRHVDVNRLTQAPENLELG